MTSSYLEREDVADLRDGDHGDGAEEGDHAQRGRRNATNVDALEHQYHRYKLEFQKNIQGTVGSDEKFQIPGQKIFFEISGPGPSYTSIGSSQHHIWSYFEHIC